MTLMLTDAASLYFRAFYGVPGTVTAADGTPVNAVRGYLDMTATLLTRFRPLRMVACWDFDWRPAWRVELVPSYKTHRLDTDPGADVEQDAPDELSVQVPVIAAALDALGIATMGAKGYEADDVIASLAERESGAVDVVTGDRDLFQLIDDAKPVRVLYTGRGVAKLQVFDGAELHAKYGVWPHQYADFATLRGDASDGLPGVAGIGEKTAAGLLAHFDSLDELVATLDTPDNRLAAGVAAKLRAARDYLAVAPTVVRTARDIALPTSDDVVPATPADPDALAELAERWNIAGPLARVVKAMGTNK